MKKIKDTIKKYGLLDRGDTVIAAVSGGVDSMVMLYALNGLKEEFDLSLIVCHLNHGLRGRESERDYNFVKRITRRLGLGFEGGRLKPGEIKSGKDSLQEAARKKRYKLLEDTAKKYSAAKIALGHTMDDQAETVLMRFIKGSALTGLAGIRPLRGPFIRPLIEIKKEELLRFAGKSGIKYVLDSSNLSPKYLRNDLRLNLIPLIEEYYNPNLSETLSRTASILSADGECLAKLARDAMSKVIIKKGKKTLVLDRTSLIELSGAIASRIFLNSIEILKGKSETYSVHVKSFFKIIKGESPGASIKLPGGVRVLREYDRIIISTEKAKELKYFYGTLNVPGITRLKGTGYVFKSEILKKAPKTFAGDVNTAYFDYAAINAPINIRPMKPGDRITPFGMRGSKKLKEIFIEKKVPKARRAGVPVFSSGGNVLWAAGLRQSGLFKVEKTTKQILKIERSTEE